MKSKSSTIIRWFPPSWLLITYDSKVIYIDPAWIQKNFNTHQKKIIFSHYPKPIDGLPEPEMPKADYILLTHHHQDHIKTATLKRLTTNKTVIYAPAKCAELIKRKFIEVRAGSTFKLDNISVQVVDAYNTPEGHSTRKQHHKGECVGYLLTINGKTIYHAGDTDVIPEMKKFGRVGIAFLPIGGTFTMDASEAVKAAQIIKPNVVVPMHYLNTKPEMFEKAMCSKGNVKVLKIGEIIVF